MINMKPYMSSLLLIFSFTTLFACNSEATNSSENTISSTINVAEEQLDTAYFASGCFWCVEAVFESVIGVEEAVSGYAGGSEKNPTYQEVSAGRTSHAEAVMVIYNNEKHDFQTLVQVFFGSHDPTTLNRQGPDRGPQYRSIAFYQNEKEQKIIEDYIERLNQSDTYVSPIVTEVKELDSFWKAEEYHQNYEQKNPNDSYVRNVSIPRLNRFKDKFPDLLKGSH
jgi:peptide-methionine (S)-S-oxide reductase